MNNTKTIPEQFMDFGIFPKTKEFLEKEKLNIENQKFQADLDKVLQDKEHDIVRLGIERKKIVYERIRLIFYGIAVISGVVFIAIKAATLLNTTP
jgi:hypothetical protein